MKISFILSNWKFHLDLVRSQCAILKKNNIVISNQYQTLLIIISNGEAIQRLIQIFSPTDPMQYFFSLIKKAKESKAKTATVFS